MVGAEAAWRCRGVIAVCGVARGRGVPDMTAAAEVILTGGLVFGGAVLLAGGSMAAGGAMVAAGVFVVGDA